ncbi:LacI family transcriptional regulator [Anaerococcus sp. WCA-380-WT-2B]|uniref:LacI family transcriptional regulator n=1 Tax=Anaerococcus porci TaxID=2652269 RepID=A0A6N7VSR5_9FIRM|nr:LacI family DNA-binding transcriptional regulator [Anaerococcus porci]MSS76847.1 LacI family transcriptional regulator [Anaerococcus porci]
MAQPTIKDVAKLAGVSISTVSRVMNDSKPVSPEARRKVLDAINKLDFKPNELARSLVMKKSNLIGVIVEDIGIEYMDQLIRGVEEIGHLYKYDIILSSTYGDDNALENAIEFLSTKQVEGIVVISENISAEVLVKLRDNKTPFILLDKFHDFKKLNTVKIDYLNEQYKLIEYLNSLGHENIAYVTKKDHDYLSDIKIEGYKKFMEKKNLEPIIIEARGNSSDDGYNIGEEVISQVKSKNLSAISFINDQVAVGFIAYCYDNGIKVPDDFSVVGFGDSEISRVYRPKLTTVSIPNYDIGAICIRALIKRIRGEEDILENNWILDAQLISRDSTKSR